MEEILASIRRIIADEDKPPFASPLKAVAAVAVAPPTETVSEEDLDKLFSEAAPYDDVEDESEDADILTLTEDAIDKSAHLQIVDEDTDLTFSEPAPAPKPARPSPQKFEPAPMRPTPRPPAPDPEPLRLVSEATDQVVGAAFDSLAMTLLSKNSRTLEDLVQDMLRPMLKEWLDKSLPSMVERMVRAEIERVSRSR